MKRVRFTENTPKAVVDEVPMTDEEEALLYYSRDELADIIGHCKAVILGQSKDSCTRGLELMNNTEQRSQHKVIVRKVLREQTRQRLMGSVDEEALANVAQEASAHRMKLAMARGKQDAKAAKEGVWNRLVNGAKKSSLRTSLTKLSETRKQERRANRAIRTNSNTTPART